MRGTVLPIGWILLLGAILTGCAPKPAPTTGATAGGAAARPEIESETIEPAPLVRQDQPAPASQGTESVPEYVIQEGDLLGIKFFFNPELNEEVAVRPDGRISLQLVPEIVAAGRTPTDLTRSLKALYAGELDSPEISVIVRSFSAQRVYVDGEVNQGGELELVKDLTVLGAIASARGMTDEAYKEQVMLIRRGDDRRPVVRELNVEQIRKGRQPDPMLQPYDVVFVPMTKISIWNRWVDQYIRKSIPVSFGFRIDIVD